MTPATRSSSALWSEIVAALRSADECRRFISELTPLSGTRSVPVGSTSARPTDCSLCCTTRSVSTRSPTSYFASPSSNTRPALAAVDRSHPTRLGRVAAGRDLADDARVHVDAAARGDRRSRSSRQPAPPRGSHRPPRHLVNSLRNSSRTCSRDRLAASATVRAPCRSIARPPRGSRKPVPTR